MPKGRATAKANTKPPTTNAAAKPPSRNDWTAQRYETRLLAELRPHPDNPHAGDEEAIDESVAENGAFGALGIQASTGYILHGNHTYKVLRARGEAEFACIVYDVDDDLALRIMVAHNETQRGGKTKDTALADLLPRLSTTRGLGLRPPEVSRLWELARPKLGYLEKLRAAEAAENALRAPALAAGDTAEVEGDGDEERGDAEQEDYEDEDAAGPPESEDAGDSDEHGEEDGPGPLIAEGRVASADREERREIRQRPLAVVLTANEHRRWEEYKKRVGERRDTDAFLVMLRAVMNADDGD